ncbi:MAG: PQQ-binding-like beta-propeller repeat protein [Magnetospirillum sp.]|nr:PQQ-binding-like beta-propeller repeat protein [Magnetospirillum sp.]
MKSFLAVAALIGLCALPALAGQPVTTTLLSRDALDQNKDVSWGKGKVAPTRDSQTAQTVAIAFSPRIPPGSLTRCAVRVVAQPYAGSDLNLELVDAQGEMLGSAVVSASPLRQRIDLGGGAQSGLCQAIDRMRGSGKPLSMTIRVQTVTADTLTLWGADDRSLEPRLIVTYEEPGVSPSQWLTLRGNAQHNGRAPLSFRDNEPPRANPAPSRSFPGDGVRARDVHAVPLVVGRRLVATTEKDQGTYALSVFDLNGRTLGSQRLASLPKFLSASPQGRIAVVTVQGNDHAVAFYELSPQGQPFWAGRGNLVGGGQVTAVPAFGADGSLYVATDRNVMALTPDGRQKWWRRSVLFPNGAVALSEDGTTVYVLSGGDDAALLALDASNGQCRWKGRISLEVGNNDQLLKGISKTQPAGPPVPVAARKSVYLTNRFPTGEELYVFKEVEDGGEDTATLPDGDCVDNPKRLQRLATNREGGVTLPVIGSDDTAYYVDGKRICAHGDKRNGCYALTCEAGVPTMLVADSSDPPRLVGINDAGTVAEITLSETEPKTASCLQVSSPSKAPKQKPDEDPAKGPNLAIAPNGMLVNLTNQQRFSAFAPSRGAGEYKVTREKIVPGQRPVFRAARISALAITLDEPVAVTMWASERITLGDGFRVGEKATLYAEAGDLP